MNQIVNTVHLISLRIMPYILSFSLLLLLTSCQVQSGHVTFGGPNLYAPKSNIEITTVFLCNGLSEANQPIEVPPIFLDNVESVHICAYQQKGDHLFLTIHWFQTKGGYLTGTSIVETNNGWFSAEIKAPKEGFPAGVYKVQVEAGIAIQATTEFEVISR